MNDWAVGAGGAAYYASIFSYILLCFFAGCILGYILVFIKKKLTLKLQVLIILTFTFIVESVIDIFGFHILSSLTLNLLIFTLIGFCILGTGFKLGYFIHALSNKYVKD